MPFDPKKSSRTGPEKRIMKKSAEAFSDFRKKNEERKDFRFKMISSSLYVVD